MERSSNDLDLVADPVSHISISGFHGVEEVVEHLDAAATQDELNGERRGPSLGTLLLGAAIGAAVMYILDPAQGSRRRALARDKAVRFGRVAGERAGELVRRLRNTTGDSDARGRLPDRRDGDSSIGAVAGTDDMPTA